jgi:nucleotide-binding universal stress UspA family protein
MYRRILLAADGSRESLIALREGALIAAAYNAAVFLLVIEREAPGVRVADGIYPLPITSEVSKLMQLGLDRLRRLGVEATGAAVSGDPTAAISKAARKFNADLVVVGHRRQSALERWWSGSAGAYLVDNVPCSVLIARDVISDEEFESHLAAATPAD